MKDNSLRQKLNSCSKVHGYSSVCAILLLQVLNIDKNNSQHCFHFIHCITCCWAKQNSFGAHLHA